MRNVNFSFYLVILGFVICLAGCNNDTSSQDKDTNSQASSSPAPDPTCNEQVFQSNAEKCECLKDRSVPDNNSEVEYVLYFEGKVICNGDSFNSQIEQLQSSSSQFLQIRGGATTLMPDMFEVWEQESPFRFNVEKICTERIRFFEELVNAGWEITEVCDCNTYKIRHPRGRDLLDQGVDPRETIAEAQTTLQQGSVHVSENFLIDLKPYQTEPQASTSSDVIITCQEPSLGNEVTVAIIDLGMGLDHPALNQLVWSRQGTSQFCYNDNGVSYNSLLKNSSDVYDSTGHGTHIAGIIGLPGIRNSNPQLNYPTDYTERLNLLSIKLTEKEKTETDLYALVCAIQYAILNGADIINISLGYYASQPDTTLAKALSLANELGILVVAAAGNDSINTDSCLHWPSGFSRSKLSNVISVAALGEDGKSLAPFSNFGEQTVQIAAPGLDICSASIRWKDNKEYTTMSGTSMAAPFVSRLAAIHKLNGNIPRTTPFWAEFLGFALGVSSNRTLGSWKYPIIPLSRDLGFPSQCN